MKDCSSHDYSDLVSQGRIYFQVNRFPEEIIIKDILNEENYTRSAEEINDNGLFIELQSYQTHIFAV